ncbi:MAG TPA: hypothetical protein VK765_02660 [Solirubrobacteraceae bacterium]|jgi:hypothetical protein|nr:hypothetical protein [Solirubrobacteraceae bacterium]
MCACAVAVLSLALAQGAVGDTQSSSTAAGSTGATTVTGTTGLTGATGTGQVGQGSPSAPKSLASATLEQCATATAPQTERSATLVGEMSAIAGTARMQIDVQLQERSTVEGRFRTVHAPALGVWHSSNPGVKVFAHIQQVTNLSAPAVYRGLIGFRWLDAEGHVLKSESLHTAVCEQPSKPAGSTNAPGGASDSAPGS